MQTLRGLKIMLKKKKKEWSKLLIRLTERGRWGLERWAFMLISKVKVFRSKAYSQLVITMSCFRTSKAKLQKLPRDLLKNVGKLLMYMAAISVMLICWLSLLMPVLVLYVVELPLVLNHFVLTRLRTRRSQAATK